jgi:HprK-related kinase A
VKVGDLSFAAADEAFRTSGLVVGFGPFAFRLKIRDADLTRILHQLYAEYPLLAPADAPVFCEMMIIGERPWRSFFRRSFVIYADGAFRGRSFDLPIALPTLEWTMNYVIATTAHRYLMLHSAVVERSGLAVLMPGDPGSGKSTLCAALLGRGWRLLSDEFVLLRPEDGMLVPMPRPVSLKNRSIELIRHATPELRFGPVISGTPKGDVALAAPPLDSIRRQHEPARPRWVVFPKWQADAPGPQLTALSRAQAFADLTDHAMNYEITGETGFHTVSRLVRDCEAFRFSFNRLDEALDTIETLHDRAAAAENVPGTRIADARAS